MHVTVEDLLPLVAKLTRDERIRLAQLALQAEDSEKREGPAEVYRSAPVQGHEVADHGRERAVRGEITEEIRALPVRAGRQDQRIEIAADRVHRFRILRRGSGQRGRSKWRGCGRKLE